MFLFFFFFFFPFAFCALILREFLCFFRFDPPRISLLFFPYFFLFVRTKKKSCFESGWRASCSVWLVSPDASSPEVGHDGLKQEGDGGQGSKVPDRLVGRTEPPVYATRTTNCCGCLAGVFFLSFFLCFGLPVLSFCSLNSVYEYMSWYCLFWLFCMVCHISFGGGTTLVRFVFPFSIWFLCFFRLFSLI